MRVCVRSEMLNNTRTTDMAGNNCVVKKLALADARIITQQTVWSDVVASGSLMQQRHLEYGASGNLDFTKIAVDCDCSH